jgi:hypothetical protein
MCKFIYIFTYLVSLNIIKYSSKTMTEVHEFALVHFVTCCPLFENVLLVPSFLLFIVGTPLYR